MDCKPTLLGLPGEVRNAIFESVFSEHSFPAPFADALWGAVPVSQHWQLQVRLTCRQINEEIAPLVFSRTRFVVESWNELIKTRIRHLPRTLASSITSVELPAYFKDTQLTRFNRTEFPYVGRIGRDYRKQYGDWICEAILDLPALGNVYIHYGAYYLLPRDLEECLPAAIKRTDLGGSVIMRSQDDGPCTLRIKRRLKGVLVCSYPCPKFDETREITISTKEFPVSHIAKIRNAGVEYLDGYPRVKIARGWAGCGTRRGANTLREDYILWVSQIGNTTMAEHLAQRTLPHHELQRYG